MTDDARPFLPVALFAVATLGPAGLIAVAILVGGAWLWGAVMCMLVLAPLVDRLSPAVAGDAPEGAEFPAGDALLVALALAHFLLLALAVRAVAGVGGLQGGERVLAFVAAGLWFGQVAHPAAHELIHRGQRGLFRLGAAIYASLLFGQHVSAHRLVHHRHVATPEDPNTARSGEGFYRFAWRAWRGSLIRGAQVEAALRSRGKGAGLHPYVWHGLGYLAAAALSLWLAWPAGVLAWVGLALHAQSQILLSDYVQHYGLVRRVRPDGRREPVGPRHSWNAAPWFSSALMLNAPRHSDHHQHPTRPFPALRLHGEAPRLPWPLPVACAVALVPPLWRRAMRGPLAEWRRAAVADGGVTGLSPRPLASSVRPDRSLP